MPACLQPRDHRIEILARDGRIDAPKRIIRAEFEDDAPGILRHRPVNTGEPVGGGIAGDAALDDGDVVALVAQRFFELRRETCILWQLITGGKTIAESHDLQGRCHAHCRRRDKQHR